MLASLPLMAALAGFIQSPAVDELTSLARVGPESVLAARARDRPNDVRDALRRLFIQAANDPSDTIPLIISGRLVQAYTLAWRDSFLLRQVAWFAARSPSERRSKVRGDSLRRAGNDALSRVGVQAALLDWREGLARYQHLADSAGTAATFGNIGAGFYEANTPDSAEDYLQRSRQLAERIGDYRTLGNAIGTLGAIRMDRGDLRGASEFFSKAAELRKRTGDDRGAAADQNNVGLIAQELGDWNSARLAFADALALNRAAGRDEPAAANLMNLANVDLLAGAYSEAATRYDEALALYRAHDNHVDEALVVHNLGLLHLAPGGYRAARRRWPSRGATGSGSRVAAGRRVHPGAGGLATRAADKADNGRCPRCCTGTAPRRVRAPAQRGHCVGQGRSHTSAGLVASLRRSGGGSLCPSGVGRARGRRGADARRRIAVPTWGRALGQSPRPHTLVAVACRSGACPTHQGRLGAGGH